MAAPDAKTSPSNKEVQQSSESLGVQVVAANGKSMVAVTTVNSPTKAATTATATATEAPSTNVDAPTYGSSETSEKYVLAKSLLGSGDFEQALEIIEEAIQETRAVLLSVEVADSDLHESMAPFHYLYGTTLLYSIEESNDTQMTVAQPDAAPAAAQPDAAATVPQDAEVPAATDQNVEDMEIAWENLDTARNIVEAMLATDDEITADSKSKIQLDLAQILLREGDLQRLNGRYSEAVMDYEACLGLRKILLPPYDRKIADAQYNLGLSYLSNSTELQKDDENPDATKLKVGQEHCRKGVQLYVNCAQTLCGQIASLCAVDPSVILIEQETVKGGFKTTGMDEADLAMSNASQSLSAWRKTVASLTPVEEDDPRLADLRELLDEIQETVDEAERSQQAVREATQLKLRAQKAVTESDDGATTQIGFGKATMDPAAVAEAATAAKPMMVVKKKKKRDNEPSAENTDAKRSKTE